MNFLFFSNFYDNYYHPIAQVFDVHLIYLNVFVLIALVWTVNIRILRYTRPTKAILAPLGMRWYFRCWLVMKIDKFNMDALRIFIEHACIDSKGKKQSHKWWVDRVNSFKDVNTSTILIENCSQLSAEEIDEVLKRYFDFYREKDKKGSLELQFISQIKIKEGYLAPMSFIAGLDDRYDNNWSKIMTNYTSTLNTQPKCATNVIASELYFSYGWLMWGPSFQNDYTTPNKSKLILYGFGDEAKSINVIVNKDFDNQGLWENLNASNEERENFGFYGSIVGTLIDTKGYSTKNHSDIDKASLPFFSRISAKESDTTFAVVLNHYEKANPKQQCNNFFSAYLWIMFALDGDYFSPHRSVTFFEHANLPDVANYQFLASRLVDKAFSHFEMIASEKEYADRKYYFCLTFNSYIEHLFLSRLQEEVAKDTSYADWLRRNIITTQPFHIAEVLDAFDHYFDHSYIRKITNKESDRLAISRFYVSSYLPAHQKWDEKQTLEQLLSKIDHTDNKIEYQIFGCFNGGHNQIDGLASGYIIKDDNYGVVDDILMADSMDSRCRIKSIADKTIFQLEKISERTENRALSFVLIRVSNETYNKHTLFSKEQEDGFYYYDRSRVKRCGWLINRDPKKLTPVDRELVERAIDANLSHKQREL